MTGRYNEDEQTLRIGLASDVLDLSRGWRNCGWEAPDSLARLYYYSLNSSILTSSRT